MGRVRGRAARLADPEETSQRAEGDASAVDVDGDLQLCLLKPHPRQDLGHFIEQILHSAAV